MLNEDPTQQQTALAIPARSRGALWTKLLRAITSQSEQRRLPRKRLPPPNPPMSLAPTNSAPAFDSQHRQYAP
jgi:hypothetical protein